MKYQPARTAPLLSQENLKIGYQGDRNLKFVSVNLFTQKILPNIRHTGTVVTLKVTSVSGFLVVFFFFFIGRVILKRSLCVQYPI